MTTTTNTFTHNLVTLDSALESAIDQAIREAARCPGKGVLVTRQDFDSYTVKLSTDVPFGTTKELDLL
jgi:hypothetical protein